MSMNVRNPWSHFMNVSKSSSPLYLGTGVTAAMVLMNIIGIDVDGSLSITHWMAVVIPCRIRN